MVLSSRELDVMNVLWERGSGTVSEVLDGMQDELAYTTVLTILQRLEDKGHVRHESEGKAHRYFPLLDQGRVQDRAIQRMTRKLFGDSPSLLVTRLVDRGKLTPDQLRELRALVNERLKGRGDE